MEDLLNEILECTKSYFTKMDEDITEDFQLSLIKSAIDWYKTIRNYPKTYTDEMIEADVIRYFSRRKNNLAFEVIPELYGRIGGEGLSMLTDAGTSRFWTKSTIFNDVLPICEVV